ncbi:hypothetical protein [Gibbsiella quercinecans]|nr:hypothetical protein [Gibbsiella quercinecans]
MKRQYFKQPEAATPQDITAALAGIFCDADSVSFCIEQQAGRHSVDQLNF